VNPKKKMGMIDTRRIPPSIEKIIDSGINPKNIDASFD
jgi:hypothetical protein